MSRRTLTDWFLQIGCGALGGLIVVIAFIYFYG